MSAHDSTAWLVLHSAGSLTAAVHFVSTILLHTLHAMKMIYLSSLQSQHCIEQEWTATCR